MQKRTLVYPGSFDPVTNGHLDLVKRGLHLFGHVIVAVVVNPNKKPLFTLEERLHTLRESVDAIGEGIEVDSFQGLLVDYMRKKNARAVLRGLRAVSDFEYEMEMALTNRRLAHDIETIFMAPSEEYIFLRASTVKEVARLGGDISSFVPANVETLLKERFHEFYTRK